jgi:hypothetical protein
MRTTLDLPDEMFRQVKARAAIEGTTLKDLLARYVQSGLRQTDPPARRLLKRSKLPIIKSRGERVIPNLTPERQARLEEEEDLAKLHRSFGR